ncbi:vesicle transport protein [Anaeramoeba ignava]|uniref:Vesicle transport protein n=1 Tax=Anaeramoeba ignava TaxID=1746090 RepID=A0A9Q0LEP6_ANAIG|nr:vesicle transport protein [Anaeramoeba ignava]
MEAFQKYQQEFSSIFKKIQETISRIYKSIGEDRKLLTRSGQKDLIELNSLLEKMSLEIVNIDQKEKNSAKTTLEDLQKQFFQIQNDLRVAASSLTLSHETNDLFAELDYFDEDDPHDSSLIDPKNKKNNVNEIEMSQRIDSNQLGENHSNQNIQNQQSIRQVRPDMLNSPSSSRNRQSKSKKFFFLLIAIMLIIVLIIFIYYLRR